MCLCWFAAATCCTSFSQQHGRMGCPQYSTTRLLSIHLPTRVQYTTTATATTGDKKGTIVRSRRKRRRRRRSFPFIDSHRRVEHGQHASGYAMKKKQTNMRSLSIVECSFYYLRLPHVLLMCPFYCCCVKPNTMALHARGFHVHVHVHYSITDQLQFFLFSFLSLGGEK